MMNFWMERLSVFNEKLLKVLTSVAVGGIFAGRHATGIALVVYEREAHAVRRVVSWAASAATMLRSKIAMARSIRLRPRKKVSGAGLLGLENREAQPIARWTVLLARHG
jgi:hypothetical protein